MKRNLIVIILSILLLLFSCTEPTIPEPPVVPETPETPVEPEPTPEETLTIQAQIEKAIAKLGTVSQVYSNTSAVAPTASSRALVSSKMAKERVTVDGNELDLYSILVAYDDISGDIAEHLKKLTSSDEGNHPGNSFDFSAIGGKVYIEYRFHYFAGTANLAFMEVRLYNNLALDTSFKVTEFSKDFLYDIINQVRMTDGVKVGYNWEKQEEKEADRFVLTTTSNIPPFAAGLKNTWVMMDDDDEIVTHSYSAGIYLQELAFTEELSTLFKNPAFFASPIEGTPDIDGYNEGYNQDSVYVKIKKYPPRFRSAYSIWAYWFEDGRWNATEHVFTDESYRVKNWKPVTDASEVSMVNNAVSFMGTPTRIYQQYIGDEKITRIWSSDIKGTYIIEFSSFKEGAKTAARRFNPSGREYESDFRRSEAGPLSSDTVATVELIIYENDYKQAIIMFKNGDKVFDTEQWLTISENTINGIDVDSLDIGDGWISLDGSSNHYDLLDQQDYPVPVFGNPNKIWQLRDQNGNNVTAIHTAGFYLYELPMTFQDKAFLEEYQDDDTDDQDLVMAHYGYAKADKNCFYANVMPTPPDHRTPCFINFAWWDGDGWQHSIGMQADEQRHMMIWKDVEETDPVFGSLYKAIEQNIGKIESVKQLYAGDEPRLTVWEEPILGDYVLQLETFNPLLREAIKNRHYRKLFSRFYDETGKLDDDTVCNIHLLYYNENRITAAIMLYSEDDDGSWDNSYAFLPCSKDFSIVNGTYLGTGTVPDVWISTSPWEKGNYVEIADKSKAGFYTADRIWERQDENGNSMNPANNRSYHILELKPTAEITKLTERYKLTNYHENSLTIEGFTYLKADETSVYVGITESVQRNPYFLTYYWHEADGWYQTVFLRANNNQQILTWEDVTDSADSTVTTLKSKLEKIGNINKVYMRYAENKPYIDKYGEKSFIVEFTDYNQNLVAAVEHNNDRIRRNVNLTHSEAGMLNENSTCFMMMDEAPTGTFSSSFAMKKGNGYWDNYYYYLNCTEDFSIINGVELSTGNAISEWTPIDTNGTGFYREITDLQKPGFYEPKRVWEFDEANNSLLASYIIEVDYNQEIQSILDTYGAPEEDRPYLWIRGHRNQNADPASVYINIQKYSSSIPYRITYYWKEGDVWHATIEREADINKNFLVWKDITNSSDPKLTALKNNLMKIGTVNKLYMCFIDDKPYVSDRGEDKYIAEFSNYVDNLKTAVDYNNENVHRGTDIRCTEAGLLDVTTTCTMYIDSSAQKTYFISPSLKNSNGSWDKCYRRILCNYDFSIINGIDINTGEVPDGWFTNLPSKEKFAELQDKTEPGFYSPTRVWQFRDGDGNPWSNNYTKARYIIEVKPDNEMRELMKRYDSQLNTKNLSFASYSYSQEDKNSVYIHVDVYKHESVPYSLAYKWYSNGSWRQTENIAADENKNILHWKDIQTSIAEEDKALVTNIDKLGTIHKCYKRECNPNSGRTDYIVELKDCNPNLLVALDNSASIYKDYKLSTEAGPIHSGTQCIIPFTNEGFGNSISFVFIRESETTWKRYVLRSYNNDFSVINGIDINTGKPVN